MGVSGGAIFPPIQGAIADAKGTRISYLVPMVGFVYVLGYVTVHWVRNGMGIMAPKAEPTLEEIIDKEKSGAIVEEHEKRKEDDMA